MRRDDQILLFFSITIVLFCLFFYTWLSLFILCFICALLYYDFNPHIDDLQGHGLDKVKSTFLKVQSVITYISQTYLTTLDQQREDTTEMFTQSSSWENRSSSTATNRRSVLSPISCLNSSSILVRNGTAPFYKGVDLAGKHSTPIKPMKINPPDKYSLSDTSYTTTPVSHKNERQRGGSPICIPNSAGPLLASSRYNIGMGMMADTQSPGLTSRIVKYNEEYSSPSERDKNSNRATHLSRYSSPGQFPLVNLNKKTLANQNQKSPSTPRPVTVRIAPPDNDIYTPKDRSLILTNSLLTSPSSSTVQFTSQSEISTRSVLDALKEISRKRIHARDDSLEKNKKHKKNSVQLSSGSLSHQMASPLSKRSRDIDNSGEEALTEPGNGLSPTPKKYKFTGQEIISSWSSSVQLREQLNLKRKNKLLEKEAKKQFKSSAESTSNSIKAPETYYDPVTKEISFEKSVNKSDKTVQTPVKPIEPKKTESKSTSSLKSDDETPINNVQNFKDGAIINDKGVCKLTFISNPPEKQQEVFVPFKPASDESKKKRLAALLGALSGDDWQAKALTKKFFPDENKTDTVDSSVHSILVTAETQKPDSIKKHVTFDLPEKTSIVSSTTPAMSTLPAAEFTTLRNPEITTTSNSITEPISSTKISQTAAQSSTITLPSSPSLTFGTSSSNASITTSTSSSSSGFNFPASTTSANSITTQPSTVGGFQFELKTTTEEKKIGGFSFDLKQPSTTTAASTSNTDLFGFGKKSPESTTSSQINNPPMFGVTATTSMTTLTFGATQAATTATAPSFGATTTAPSFGTTTTAPLFGVSNTTSSSTSMFGTPTTTTMFTIPVTTSAPAFGVANNTTSTTTATFGTPSTTTAVSTFGLQNSNATTASAVTFGTPNTTTTVFGVQNTTNAPPMFGTTNTTSAPLFGTTTSTANTTPAFGTTGAANTTSTFGTPNNALNFGGSTNPTPAFGMTNATTAPPAFGTTTTPLFGAANNGAKPPMFGVPTTTAGSSLPMFGATTTTTTATFGSSTAVTTAATFQFGAATTTASGFGTTTTSPPMFGTPTTTAAPAFGSNTPAFGSNNTSGGIFGNATTTANPTFGTSQNFGAPGGFGTNTTPNTFGSANSAFGAPTTTTQSTFGNTAAPAFGTTAPSFGTPATTTAQSSFNTSNTFGSPAPAFGASTGFNNNSFSSPSNFGNGDKPNAFGSTTFGANTTANTFGTATPTFGATNTNNAPTFGTPTPSNTFGTPNQNAFNTPTNTNQNIFGGSQTNDKPFGGTTFGTNNNNPTSSFGGFGTANNNNANNTVASPPNVFAFGTNQSTNNNNNNNNNSAPAFQFGAPKQPTAGAFNFTAQTNNSTPQFGAANPPAFGANTGQFQLPNAGNMFSIGTGSTAPRPRAVSRYNRKK